MKITIYELLGLVKDNKQPKKIKYYEYIYEWSKDNQDYVCDDSFIFEFGKTMYDLEEYLHREVEIIEEEKGIEKIDNAYYHENQDRINEIFKNKINDLIDEINKLKKAD